MIRKTYRCVSFILALLGVATAGAQTVANGPYYATPSWDQKLQCDTLSTCPRFIVLANWNSEAVLDRETGNVWERAPSMINESWFSSLSRCNRLAVGNRMGWRLPTIQELASLVDPTNATSPRLPAGHPFTTVQPFSVFWASTPFIDVSTGQVAPFLGWHLFFSTGAVGSGSNRALTNFAGGWCVRGSDR